MENARRLLGHADACAEIALVGMRVAPPNAIQLGVSPTSDHGINVDELPQPHRLAERGW